MVEGVLDDILAEFFKAAMSPEYKEKLAANVADKAKSALKIQQLSAFLGTNDYLVGNHITVVDIKLAYFIDFIGHAYKSAGLGCPWCKYDNLINLNKRVYGLPTLSEYIASPAWTQAPYMPPNLVKWVKLPGQPYDN
jgi:glutathione S-transferase